MSDGIFLPLASDGHRAVLARLDRRHRLAEAEHDAEVAEVVLQRLDDLGVAEVEQAVSPLDHGDPRAQGGEHRGVLDPDHAGADDDERARNPVEVQDPVRVEYRPSRRTRHPRGRLGIVPLAITTE